MMAMLLQFNPNGTVVAAILAMVCLLEWQRVGNYTGNVVTTRLEMLVATLLATSWQIHWLRCGNCDGNGVAIRLAMG